MGKKLYVGNLSYEVDSSALQEMFTPHGTVESAEIITDRDTGRSKGFGFVQMSQDSEAAAAYERATLLAPAAELHRRYPELAKLNEKYQPAPAPAEAA